MQTVININTAEIARRVGTRRAVVRASFPDVLAMVESRGAARAQVSDVARFIWDNRREFLTFIHC